MLRQDELQEHLSHLAALTDATAALERLIHHDGLFKTIRPVRSQADILLDALREKRQAHINAIHEAVSQS